MTVAVLADEARNALPPDSTWRHFEFARFVAAVEDGFKKAAAHADEALKKLDRLPPEAVWQSTLDRSLEMAGHAGALVELIVGDGSEMGAEPSGLNCFFPAGITPARGVPPRELFSRLFLAIFPIAYPYLRRIVTEFIDPVRRRAWSAWVPADPLPAASPPDAHPISPELLYRTGRLESHLGGVLVNVLTILGLLLNSNPVRRRVSEDVNFLDAVCLASIWVPSIRFVLTNAPPFREAGPGYLSTVLTEFMITTRLLRHLPLEGKPWHAIIRRQREQGYTTTVDMLISALVYFLKFFELSVDPLPEEREISQMCQAVLYHFVEYFGPLLDGFEGAETEMRMFKEFRKYSKKKQRENDVGISDACDWCAKQSRVDGDLKRCSSCVVARYCSKECQVAAWKGERVGNELPRERHKAYCFDAKVVVFEPKERHPLYKLSMSDSSSTS